MFIVLSWSDKPNPPKNPNLLEWFHVGRNRYETVEITQLSRRSLDDIKKEHPEAFEEVIANAVPAKYEKVSSILHKTEVEAPAKAIPVKPTEPNKYKCSDCQLGSASVGGIRRHITKMHGKGKADVIDIETGKPVVEDQEEVTETVIDLSEKPGIISVPDEEEVKPPVAELKCPKCDFSTDNEGGLKRHITRMHKEDSYAEAAAFEAPAKPKVTVTELQPPKITEDGIEIKTSEAVVAEPGTAEVVFVRPTAKRRDF